MMVEIVGNKYGDGKAGGMPERLLLQMMLELVLKMPSPGPARVFTCTPHSSGTGINFPDLLPPSYLKHYTD